MDQIFIDKIQDDFAGDISGNLPAVSVSPVTGRTHGAWVDPDTGRIMIGVANEAGKAWETMYEAPNIPVAHTGSDVIRHLSMVVDSSDRNALTYEYHDLEAVELWIYDERLVDGALSYEVTYACPGSSPAMMLDKDLDILCFYRATDGRICWRSRANPEGATWGTEYIVDTSTLGLTGDLYPIGAYLVGGMAEWEQCRINLILANRDAVTGRYSYKYIESAGYPISTATYETAVIDTEICSIDWSVSYEQQIEDNIGIDTSIAGIKWDLAYNPQTDAGTLIIDTAISNIGWITTNTQTLEETLNVNTEIKEISWKPVNTQQVELIPVVETRIMSIVWE
ncbi:MAG: hypothetical protein ACYC27_22325 [Armatimonadota bacterium]